METRVVTVYDYGIKIADGHIVAYQVISKIITSDALVVHNLKEAVPRVSGMESEGRYVLNFEVVQLPMRVPEYPINVLQEVNYTFNKAFLEGHVYLLLLFRGNINSDLLFVTAGLKVDWNNVEIKGRTTRV